MAKHGVKLCQQNMVLSYTIYAEKARIFRGDMGKCARTLLIFPKQGISDTGGKVLEEKLHVREVIFCKA